MPSFSFALSSVQTFKTYSLSKATPLRFVIIDTKIEKSTMAMVERVRRYVESPDSKERAARMLQAIDRCSDQCLDLLQNQGRTAWFQGLSVTFY